jgi:hypothetical protein
VESVPDPRIGFPAREAFFEDLTRDRAIKVMLKP